MGVKYYKLKLVAWSVVLFSDALGRYIWWTVIHIGERWCSLHSGLLRTVTFGMPAETPVQWPSCNSHVIVRDFNQN
jgi:hypothetical protein